MRFSILRGELCWRVISTRTPSIGLFEAVASPEDFEALFELEVAFSPHYNELLTLAYLPRSEWVNGPGASYVMAPFVYRGVSRFSNGQFGVFYAGLEEITAIQEVAFHRSRFMAETKQPAMVLEMQVLQANVNAKMVDIRGEQSRLAEIYTPDPGHYSEPQRWASSLREQGHAGIAYDSVRAPGGGCVAVFKPKAIQECGQSKALHYAWDGKKIAGWF